MPSYPVGTGTDLEEGQYAAIIQSIEPVQQDPSVQRLYDKEQLVITWKLTEVEDEDGNDITRRQYCNDVQALTPRSTLYKLFSAVLNNGQPLDKAVNYDTDQLIGKPGLIFWGAYVGQDGSTKHKILTVSPPKAAKPGGAIRRKVADNENGQLDTDTALNNL